MKRFFKTKQLALVAYGAAMAAIFAAMAVHMGYLLAPWQHKAGVWQVPGCTRPLSLVLEGPSFSIFDDSGTLWRGDSGWRVQDFLTGDVNHDGMTELLLLTWRRGNYGPSKPFWVEQNSTDSYTQHIFIYQWDTEKNTVAPIWMSSRLAPQVTHWAMTEDFNLEITTPAGEDTLWGWRSWGLERLDIGPIPIIR